LLSIYENYLSIDDLPKLTAKLRGLLTQHERPALIYSHCEAGTDRTGEVSGAYYMRYLNMSFSEALYKDNHVQNRPM
jgi:protein-tyrosine phosphatase